jgi:hypothetical protein
MAVVDNLYNFIEDFGPTTWNGFKLIRTHPATNCSIGSTIYTEEAFNLTPGFNAQ